MYYRSMLFAAVSAAVLITAAAAQDDPNKQYGARELYLRARQLPYHPTPAADSTPTAPAKAETPPAKSIPAVKPPSKSKVTKASPLSKTTTPVSPAATSASTLPEGGEIVRVSAPAPTQGSPLGLKYSILRRVNGQMVEVPKDAEFHSGDAIQIRIQTNAPGYLYIVNQGSSGQWAPMFPSPEFQGGNNQVDGWNTYTFPPRAMVFDEQTGVEKLTLLFAREPEPDFERLIYSLQGGSKPKPAAQKSNDRPQPAPSNAGSRTLMATVRISDDMVRNKRSMYSRDLVIETVTPSTPGEQKEYADYVVNPSGSPDSRVIADLKLVHK